jgi:hypothetical protein
MERIYISFYILNNWLLIPLKGVDIMLKHENGLKRGLEARLENELERPVVLAVIVGLAVYRRKHSM